MNCSFRQHWIREGKDHCDCKHMSLASVPATQGVALAYAEGVDFALSSVHGALFPGLYGVDTPDVKLKSCLAEIARLRSDNAALKRRLDQWTRYNPDSYEVRQELFPMSSVTFGPDKPTSCTITTEVSSDGTNWYPGDVLEVSKVDQANKAVHVQLPAATLSKSLTLVNTTAGPMNVYPAASQHAVVIDKAQYDDLAKNNVYLGELMAKVGAGGFTRGERVAACLEEIARLQTCEETFSSCVMYATGGRLSKTNYEQSVYEYEIDNYYEQLHGECENCGGALREGEAVMVEKGFNLEQRNTPTQPDTASQPGPQSVCMAEEMEAWQAYQKLPTTNIKPSGEQHNQPVLPTNYGGIQSGKALQYLDDEEKRRFAQSSAARIQEVIDLLSPVPDEDGNPVEPLITVDEAKEFLGLVDKTSVEIKTDQHSVSPSCTHCSSKSGHAPGCKLNRKYMSNDNDWPDEVL